MRPEGWVNEQTKSEPEGLTEAYDKGYGDGKEAGADAMLEGLKNSEYRVAVSAFSQFTTDVPAVNGYLVFIPEEE